MAGGQLQGFGAAVYRRQASQAKFEMVPARLRQVLNFLGMCVKTARRKLVQQWLPDMGANGINKCYFRQSLFAEVFTQLRGQRQTACTAANNHDAWKVGGNSGWLQ